MTNQIARRAVIGESSAPRAEQCFPTVRASGAFRESRLAITTTALGRLRLLQQESQPKQTFTIF
jgi:hypothetical protein